MEVGDDGVTSVSEKTGALIGWGWGLQGRLAAGLQGYCESALGVGCGWEWDLKGSKCAAGVLVKQEYMHKQGLC